MHIVFILSPWKFPQSITISRHMLMLPAIANNERLRVALDVYTKPVHVSGSRKPSVTQSISYIHTLLLAASLSSN